MNATKIADSNIQIRRVTNFGIVINILLSIVKIVFGILGHSMSTVADGIHSLSDMLTDLAVLLGIYLGAKEPDFSHPYGHGRMETFSAASIALVLVTVGIGMVYQAGKNLAAPVHMPGYTVMLVALISITSKEYLYRVTKKVAVRSHSSALYANAWHHRTDAFSSIAVLIGLVSMKFGFMYGDRLAAIAVGIMIALAGARILSGCFQELAESSIDKQTLQTIQDIISQKQGVESWHNLRTRKAGREVFVDVHILVDPDLNIKKAHQISEELETNIHQQIARPVNVIIHVEPDLPQLRK